MSCKDKKSNYQKKTIKPIIVNVDTIAPETPEIIKQKSDYHYDDNSGPDTEIEADFITKGKKNAINGVLYRTIEGEPVEIKLNGSFRMVVSGTKNKSGAGSGYDTLPLLIEEVIPNVIRYDHYIEDDLVSEYDNTPYHHKRPEPALLEFFSEEGLLLKIYDIEENNPYLNDGKNIRIKREFWDSEIYSYAPPQMYNQKWGNKKCNDTWTLEIENTNAQHRI